MAGQGGRLCHPGPRGALRVLCLGLLQQCGGPAVVRDRGAGEGGRRESGTAMSVDRLICHVLPKAFLMALVDQGRLAELQIVRRDRPSRVESIFLGRLERVMPELDAAFVDIGIGRSGFLRGEDRAGIDDWPPAGAPLLVQMRHEGDGEKGPRLTMDLAVTGRYL